MLCSPQDDPGSLRSHSPSPGPEKVPAIQLLCLEIPHMRNCHFLPFPHGTGYTYTSNLNNTRAQDLDLIHIEAEIWNGPWPSFGMIQLALCPM